jgi:hypothetical protein
MTKIWCSAYYSFDEGFQQDEVTLSFTDIEADDTFLLASSIDDDEHGILVAVEGNSMTYKEMNRDEYTDRGEQDPWPDSPTEWFFTWEDIWTEYNEWIKDKDDEGEEIPILIMYVDQFSRRSVEQDTDFMYIFTDNAERTSAPKSKTENIDKDSWYYKKYKSTTNKPLHYGTSRNPTSAVIRGLTNAYPISTMSAYGTNWTTDEYHKFCEVIDDEISQIKSDVHGYLGIKLFRARIGQGGRFAKIPPKLQDYLDTKLAELGIINGGT